jgi:hypothetical protein
MAVPADFQELMRNAPDITNCVEACNLEGRGERMDNLLAQLEMCEKALQDYLETKRIAFPRFYFVAPMGEQRPCEHFSTAMNAQQQSAGWCAHASTACLAHVPTKSQPMHACDNEFHTLKL